MKNSNNAEIILSGKKSYTKGGQRLIYFCGHTFRKWKRQIKTDFHKVQTCWKRAFAKEQPDPDIYYIKHNPEDGPVLFIRYCNAAPVITFST